MSTADARPARDDVPVPVPVRFAALPPQRVPTRDALREDAGPALMTDVAAYAGRAPGMSHAAHACALAALCERIPEAPSADRAVVAPAGPAAPADDAEHDAYFGVRRVQGPAGAAFLRSILSAAHLFHAEMDDGGDNAASGFPSLGGGFTELLADLAGAAPGDPAPTRAKSASAKQVDPMRRWIVGHQVFTALTQGILYALQAFETAATGRDEAAAAAAGLVLAAGLLRASAAAFRFTGDFPASAYRDVVRPSMTPPHVGAGFSGLLSADHRRLIQVLGRLRPLMAEAAVRFAPQHAALTAGLQLAYDDHKFVCARFDGAAGPSLRGKQAEHGSGVEQLERFRVARLRLVDPPPPGSP